MGQFVIKNSKGTELPDLQNWEEGFKAVDKEPKHWKKDYSAHSLARFFTEGKEIDGCSNGQRWIEGLSKHITGEQFNFGDAQIEHASKLDNRKGGQRMQDLSIWGTAANSSIFIGIEAKVLESFDKTVVDAYNEAVKYRDTNPHSKKAERIEDLVARFFPTALPTDGSVRNLRYQLLHYVAASEKEGATLKESNKPLEKRSVADIIILPVLVFKTDHYKEDEKQALRNKNDYFSCLPKFGFKVDEALGNYSDTCIYVLNRKEKPKVYSLYAEIELP